MKNCPECAEEVQAAARVCRYCGYRFVESQDSGTVSPLDEAPPQHAEAARESEFEPFLAAHRPVLIGIGVAFVLLVVLAIGKSVIDNKNSGGSGGGSVATSSITLTCSRFMNMDQDVFSTLPVQGGWGGEEWRRAVAYCGAPGALVTDEVTLATN